MPRLLIVDDEPVVRLLLREVLAETAFDIGEAGTLAMAHLEAKRVPPDVVLVDKNLPDGSGLDFIRDLKAADPHVEAILITAFATLESAIAAIEVGAFDYLQKPFPELPAILLKVKNAGEKARVARLEAQHRHAQKMEAVGRLASGVAHDFNNMLCVVLNCADEASEHVRKGLVGPHTTEALDDIKVAVESATRLTRQLLAFSRRPSGSSELLEINAVLGEMRSMLGRVLGPEISLMVTLDRDAGHVRMPRTQLEQVVANLVVNARDALARRGTVTVETVRHGDHTEISIGDTGAGMPPEIMSRIFEPFFTTKAVGRGTGLGLAMVRTIVDEAGGTVTVESQLGAGTRFRIALPNIEDAGATSQARTADSDRLPPGAGRRVLLAEDDPQLRALLTRMFQRAGYRVTAAVDGVDAIDRFDAAGGDFDLLVTDVVMPRRSGDELAAILHRQKPSLKTIYMSGNADFIAPASGTDLTIIPKPFSEGELGAHLRSVLAGEGP